MKKVFFIIALCFVAQIKGFAQSQFANVDSVKNYLAGDWEWFLSCGGIAGTCSTPTTPGYSSAAFKFVNTPLGIDSIGYLSYHGGTLSVSGKVRIISNTSNGIVYWSLEKICLYPVAFCNNMMLLFARPDSILFRDNCSDCFDRQYKRNNQLKLGLENLELGYIQLDVYPSLFSDKVFVSYESDLIIKNVVVFDMIGNYYNKKLGSEKSIDMSDLSSGLYFITFETNKGAVTKRIAKE